jgi:cardiolipin synthase
VNAANIISLARLLSVPLTVWLVLSGAWVAAFVWFLAAGLSDAVDGVLAKRYGMATELGGFLDPLADKALLVSIYVALGVQGHLPNWLVILVVSRDVLIVGGVLLSFAMALDLAIRPRFVSKANTVAQIALAAAVLGDLAGVPLPNFTIVVLIATVTATTLASGAIYLVVWARGQGADGAS